MADSWMYQPAAMVPSTDAESSTVAVGAGQSGRLSAIRDTTSPPDGKAHAAKIRRRNRQINSCLECRRRKLKCDKQAPCANCTRFKRDCLYISPATDSHSQQKLAEIKERMGAYEKDLELKVAKNTAKAHAGGSSVTKPIATMSSCTHIDNYDDDGVDDDEEGLEPTPLAALDNVYEDNDADDELIDLGVQMGRMRITERIGGFIRPKLVEELNDTLHDVTAGKSRQSPSSLASDHREVKTEPRIQASPKSYIGPGPDYIAPASSFFFPGTNMNTNILTYLPSKASADQLIAQYMFAVHPIARAVHRPTFEAQYNVFWTAISNGNEPIPSMQAIMFAAMFSASVSMDDKQVTRIFGASKATLMDSLRSGTEMALSKANFLRTTKLDVMQAFVMYLLPLIRSEVSRAHSALVGTAIRLAECLGLHRDGSHYSMKPVEIHVRRLIWNQLLFLDMRTCEATGPRPQIRKDDYDTNYPLNVDDIDLIGPNPPTEDRPYWTDMTLMRVRCEVMDIRRTAWFDLVQIDKKKKSLTSVLVKIQRSKTAVEAKYLPMIDDSIPIQAYIRHILTIVGNGCFILILHRYLFSTSQRMPDRLRQILIEAGLTQMQNAIALETEPQLRPWYWYRGAISQYHCALLLMVEVYAYPMRKDAAKIWKCLDYIFEIPPHLSPQQKAEMVITDLRDRMEIYHQMRKLKVSTQLEERAGSLNKSSLRESTTPGSDALIDAVGQMPQSSGTTNAMGAMFASLPPQSFSSSSPVSDLTQTANINDSSRAGSEGPNGNGGDIAMQTMEEIDWAEWNKWFPLDQNNGVLNATDFEMSQNPGIFSTGTTSQPSYITTSAAAAIVSAEDLADVSFTPAYYPAPKTYPQNQSNFHS
ncbi:Hypothetical protein R9X50_00708700 [Acrodontium crateriforme]|uniref:Zn(2)-C6 fungal-type domain-containing protein n=1 Tax=Acrodontium crateriforme TaxID=150365 RepID=A0AAQ3RAH0_9PEZI|nr:Hypothetical protein R9X50_00708700 [Acrodontium crateriforme]